MKHGQCVFSSALGSWALGWGPEGITLLRPVDEASPGGAAESPAWVTAAVAALQSHFSGAAVDLAALPVAEAVFTPFQLKIAALLRASAPGRTLTYGELAFLAGRPGAARAVGQAVRRNPVLVLVPCHRVVAAQGPGGWSAFGSPGIKARLLHLESVDNGINGAPPS